MARGTFSGRDVVKVMVNSGIYEWVRTTTQSSGGSHLHTTTQTHEQFPCHCTTRSMWEH